MTGVDKRHQDVDIDLVQLFRAVWQRKAALLAATAIVTVAAFAGASMISPRYKAETRILIEARQPVLTAPGTLNMENQPVLDELNIVSQVQLLRSTDLIRQVAKDLKLFELREFDPDTDPSAISDLLVMLGLKKNPLDMKPEDRVLKAFQEKLQVYQVEKSRVIGIEFTSKDAQLAAAIPNKMAEVYRSVQSGAKLDSTSEAARWLEPEIANLREKVGEAEKKVADYRSSAGLLRTSETANFATTQLNDISVELSRVRAQRADAEAKAENLRTALKAGRPTDTLDVVTNSPVVQRLKENESQLRAQLNDLSTTLLDGHPRLKAIRAQLTGLREQIVAESNKVAASLENEAAVARLREQQLLGQLNQAKAESARAGDEEVGLKALEREAAAQRQLLETYLARYREATSKLDPNASPADARVISQATPPLEPSFPKVIPITVVAALATLILGAVIVMLSELFSGRALRPSVPDIEDEAQPSETVHREPAHVTKTPPPREMPVPSILNELDRPRAVEETLEPEEDDQFSIETVARYILDGSAKIVFAISPTGDDGAAATVMLVRELASANTRVILIDMTGSGCPTALMSPDPDLPGITDLLCGEAAFADVIHADRLSEADIIPQGMSDPHRAMRAAERLSMIADALADAYDVVIVECGPANAQAVARLSRNGEHEVLLSAPDPDKRQLAAIMDEFAKVGYDDLVLMTGGSKRVRRGRARAA
ncbi:exopolysaccharide transport family protein [Ciceribacter sp. L1K23]|uniref:GumC family protein n=1 Tax=Ciceribacter sp. L1K23 TaxID=2820276 RepID=UPI001B812A77|nr:exopolysaccharide transport family protein [Ciceribacter sp. L1K23]MBR0556054.1 exopolysaccharide transport family protein [Ciceribacter sp. L1K23]